MIVTHKYKLKPSESQEKIILNCISMLRSHYNYSLRDRIEAYEEVKATRRVLSLEDKNSLHPVNFFYFQKF